MFMGLLDFVDGVRNPMCMKKGYKRNSFFRFWNFCFCSKTMRKRKSTYFYIPSPIQDDLWREIGKYYFALKELRNKKRKLDRDIRLNEEQKEVLQKITFESVDSTELVSTNPLFLQEAMGWDFKTQQNDPLIRYKIYKARNDVSQIKLNDPTTLPERVEEIKKQREDPISNEWKFLGEIYKNIEELSGMDKNRYEEIGRKAQQIEDDLLVLIRNYKNKEIQESAISMSYVLSLIVKDKKFKDKLLSNRCYHNPFFVEGYKGVLAEDQEDSDLYLFLRKNCNCIHC